MDSHRTVLRLEEVEGRITPALTPDQVHAAAGVANFYFNGTQAALQDLGFVFANRAAVQAAAGTIIGQTPGLVNTLSEYVTQLQSEKAANPVFAEWYDEYIGFYADLANRARLAGITAQTISSGIDARNAADAARGRGQTGVDGTNGGTTGFNGFNGGTPGTGGTTTIPVSPTVPPTAPPTNPPTVPPTVPPTDSGTGSGTGRGTGTGSTPGTTTGSTPGTTAGGSTGTTPIGTT